MFCKNFGVSEGVSTGVWCVPGFGAGFEIALEASKLQKEGENPEKGHFYFLRQTLVCTKPWFKGDLSVGGIRKRKLEGGTVKISQRGRGVLHRGALLLKTSQKFSEIFRGF